MATKIQASEAVPGTWYCGFTVRPDGHAEDGLIMQAAGDGEFYDEDDFTGRDYGPEMRQYDYLVPQS